MNPSDVIERPKNVKCVLAADGTIRDQNVRPTRCGRNAKREFVFLDPGHAAYDASHGSPMVICGACVDAIVAAARQPAPGFDSGLPVLASQVASATAVFRLLHQHRWDPMP